jgi:8-oxo-dGTP pyrophosphatase MutT (NUDIX family)
MPRRPDWSHAGGLVVRVRNGRRTVLLVQARRSDAWVLPKGRIERGETPEECAVREVAEEAGVRARIVGALGSQAFRNGRGPVHVVYYLMRYVREVAPGEDRARAWLSFGKARERLSYETLRVLLDEARTRRR